MYTEQLPIQAFASGYASTCFTNPKRQLITLTVVALTIAKFKPLIHWTTCEYNLRSGFIKRDRRGIYEYNIHSDNANTDLKLREESEKLMRNTKLTTISINIHEYNFFENVCAVTMHTLNLEL
jgi:hypothetical protein